VTPLYVLAKISQFLSVLGIGMIIFGTFFARIFIRVLYTEKWATDVRRSAFLFSIVSV
jgi:O-antigen/teichoic acid export membrane protein